MSCFPLLLAGSALDEALKLVSAELLNDFRSAHGLVTDDDHDQDSISRSGRSPDSSPSPSPDHNFQRLVNITPRFRVCNNPLHITNVEFKGSYLSICISADQSRQVTIGEVSLSTNRSSSHVRITQLSRPVASAAFESSDQLHVLIADQSRSDGVTMNVFKRDFLSKPTADAPAVQPLSLNTPFPNLLKLWSGSDGTIRLAVSTLPDEAKRLSTYFSKTHFFKWDGHMFFRVGKVDSYFVSDICPFTYGGKDFVVILNSAATPSHSQIDSSVYQINFGAPNDLTLMQTIRFHSAVDCETFELPDGSNRVSKVAYLAVANNDPSVKNFGSIIYRFNGENFIASQALPTVGATKIKSYKNPATGAFALLVADKNGVKSYQYNGWRFAPSPLHFKFDVLGPGVVDMDVASVGPESLVFVCNPRTPKAANVIALAFEKDEVLKGWRTRSLEWCQSAKSVNFDDQLDHLERIMSEDVYFIDQRDPIVIEGDLHLNAAKVDVNGILSAPYVYNHEDIRPLSHKMTHDLHDLEKHLVDLERRAERATHLLSKALRLDVPDQVVTSQYTFDNLDVSCGSAYPKSLSGEPCNIGNIVTSTLNGEDVTDLSRQIIRIDRDQTITHPNIAFKHIESVSDINLYGSGLINGINISNLVSKTGRHVINSAITFAGPLSVNSIHASGLVNGIKFTDETVLLKNGDQNITSSVEFTAPLTTRNLQVDFVNEQALRTLLANIVTVDGNHVIKGKKTFKHIEVTGNMNVNSSISGIDLARIHDNLLWKDGDQIIPSNVVLDSLSVEGNLKVAGNINGISLPSQDIVLNRRREPVIITGDKTFASSIRIDHLHVKGTLNGLGLIASSQGVPLATEWPDQLNILLRSRHQSIPVEKNIAGSVHLAQHSALQGTINGVDLSQLYDAVVKHDTSSLSGSWSLFGPVTFENGLTVGGTVNGVNISNLYHHSLKLTDDRLTQLAQRFVFEHAVVTGSLSCALVNGLNLQRDLMTKHTPQQITGAKTFKNGLHIVNNFDISGTLNGLQLQFLNDSLLSSSSQVIRGPKTIHGDLFVNDLYTRLLNDIDLDAELIHLNSPREQYISGRKNLKHIKVSHGLNVKELNVAHTINTVPVHDLLNGTMLYNTPQRVTGMKTFKHITVPRDSTLTVTSLSGHDFSSLVADAVFIDRPANITGNITFNHPKMTFKSIQFFKTFDGISDRTFRNNWLLQDKDQEIDGDVILAERPSLDRNGMKRKAIEITGDLDMDGNLNGHQVRQVNSSIVKVNEPAIVRGPIIFTATVKANSHVNLSGKFQGVKLSHEAVRRSQASARIFGVKTFKSHLSINGNVTVNGYLDGIRIDDLCSTAVRSSGRQQIRYPIIVLGNVTADTLDSAGRVAGVNWRRFVNLCVHKDASALQRIRGKKHFKNLWIVAPVTTSDGNFGGVNVAKLNNDYMSLTKDQLISVRVNFFNGVSFESPVFVEGNLHSQDGLIHMNGQRYNLTNIRDSTLRLTGDQDITVPFVFKDKVEFSRDLIINSQEINRIKMSSLAPRNARKRELTGPVEFDQVFTGQLIMSEGSTIQRVDLSRIARTIVSSSAGSNNIKGAKHFSSLTVDDLYVTGTLNGFKIDKDHILLASPSARQVINARAIFNHVRVNARLDSNSINGVNLTRWSENLVLSGSNGNTTILAPKSLSGPVRAKDTWTLKLIDGLHVDDLNQAVFNRELAEEALQLERQLSFHQEKLSRISRFLDHQEQCVDHYSVTRTVPGRLIEIESTVNAHHLMATRSDDSSGGCSLLRVHHVASKIEQRYGRMVHPNLVAFITFNANGYNSFGNSSTIVSVSGSPVTQQTYSCLSPNAISAQGQYVAQILWPSGHKTYVTLKSDSPAHHLAIVRSTATEACVLIASSPESEIICLSPQKSTIQHTHRLPSRQFIVAYLPEWLYTVVASITTSYVRIYKWNTNNRNIGETIQEIKLMTPERQSHSLIHFTGSYDDPAYLVIAEAKSASIRNSRPLIRFFKRQGVSSAVAHPFIETQQTHEKENVLAMSSLTLRDQNILFLLTSDETVRVYRLQGASGWIEADTLSLESLAITSHVLSSGWSAEKGGHWLALSSHDNSSAIVETAIGFRPSH